MTTPGLTSAASQLNAALAERYVVERELGRGGMATVYLARDLRHERPVALKVLHPELAGVLGAERFLSEIRVTANLQHPNLVPLFDSGVADGLVYYVMPYVEGESLRARLERERHLPVDEAVRIGTGVAGALDYAHRHGVIHRDLKPENVLLHDGQPLVADFGIALAAANAGGSRLTQTGLSLGTPHYMSPEQAAGDRQLDARSDVFSLGAVTYEMLAGEPPHAGPTAQSVIARVLADQARPLRLARPAVPEHVAFAVERALAKLPADRWASAQQFADALRGVGVTPAARRMAWRERLRDPVVLALATTAVAASAIAAWLATHRRPADDQVVRFELPRLGPLALGRADVLPVRGGSGSVMALTPDGSLLVYSGGVAGGTWQLFARALDDVRARPLDGTVEARFPAISPDGRWLAFVQSYQLKKMRLDGGAAITLADVRGRPSAGLAWVSNDLLVVALDGRLATVPANGGAPTFVTALDTAAREGAEAAPVVVGDGDVVLYMSTPPPHMVALRLKTGERVPLDVPGRQALGMIGDQLIYSNIAGALMAVRFDPRRLRPLGAPIPVAEGLGVVPGAGVRAALSRSGTLAYQQGTREAQVVLTDVAGDRRGQTRVLVAEARRFATPRLSPDGTRLALAVVEASELDIWVYDLASGTPARLTAGGSNDRPEWTPDGRRLLFRSARGGDDNLWTQPADGSAPAVPLLSLPNGAQEGVLSRRGDWLVFRNNGSQTRRDIYYRAMRGDTTIRPLAATDADELDARLSPDDRWVAYVSDESGQLEVYVRPFPTLDGKVKVSVDGGGEPLWAPDGRTLYYRHDDQIMAVTLAAGPGRVLSVVRRDTVLRGDYLQAGIHADYDVTPDGKSLLLLKPAGEESRLVVVHNWAKEVRQRTRR